MMTPPWAMVPRSSRQRQLRRLSNCSRGEKKWGTDESIFNKVLSIRSRPQLLATFREYRKVSQYDITRSIGEEVNASVSSLGIKIIDVRLRRADYPAATSQNIFNRMKSEREREAKEFRATGEEEAQKIRADAEKTRTVIISEAQREAQETRGAGDGKAIEIYADSFGQDADFFAFYRSMEAYRKSMNNNDTSLVLSPDSSFFRFFKDKNGDE